MKNRPIGIFDSGIGGLTVLKEIVRLLPREDIVYFGDTARVPYGNKSKAAIIRFSRESAAFLRHKQVKIIVAACNTSSALAVENLKKNFDVPIIGVVEAGASKAAGLTKKKKIAVIGTSSTIKSGIYPKLILSKDKRIKVYSQACPLFVPLVEEGILSGRIVKEVIKIYLKKIKEYGVDAIILGCTHYPLLKTQISSYLRGVAVVDSAKEVAGYVKAVLESRALFSLCSKKPKVEFYLSDEPREFMRLARLFLNRKIPNPKIINPADLVKSRPGLIRSM